jgi:hypothetical protein
MKHSSQVCRPILSSLAPAAFALLVVGCSGGGGGAAAPPPLQPFSISDPDVSPGVADALLVWNTNEPASALVEWGATVAYGNSLAVAEVSLTHSLLLPGLDPESVYHFRLTATTQGGDQASSPDVSFSTLPSSAFGSEDFNADNLDRSRWSLVDPTGAAELRLTGVGTDAALVELEVPAGVESLPWTTGNGAARLMQNAPLGDWSIEARFEGSLDQAGTGHGVLVEVDADTFLRFDFAFNSNKTQVFAALLDGGATLGSYSAIIQNGAWAAGDPMWMRVTRSGQVWTQEWSVDGSGWIPGALFTFAAEPTRVGLHVVSAGSSPPGHTLVADYLFDATASVAVEDGPAPADDVNPFLYRATAEAQGDDRVLVRWWTDEPTAATVRFGLDTTYVDGVVEVVDPLYAHSALITGLSADTTYHFQVVSRDSLGFETSSSDLIATTNLPGVSGLPEVVLWYGQDQGDGTWLTRFGHLGNAQHQINILGNLRDDDEVRLVDSNSLYYQLNGGTWYPLALGDDRDISYDPWRLANEGDFNLELELWELVNVPLVGGVHRNTVVFEALDDDGNITYKVLYVDYTPDVTWQMGPAVDWSALLASGGDLQDQVQVVDGEWYVDDNPTFGPGLRLRPGALGYDRLVAIGEGQGLDSWENYEATVKATVLGFDPKGWTTGTQSYAIGMALRWSGHNQGWGPNQPSHDIYPFGGIFAYRWFETFERWELWINKDKTVIPFDAPISVGETWVFKSRCETQFGGGTRYRLKRWLDGTTEPAAWDFDYTTPADQDHPTGSLLLISHHVDVLYGNVVVTSL